MAITNSIESPIVVLGYPRSGTSLTAGLIHLHGAWAGICRAADGRNPKGFYENKEINRILTSNKNVDVIKLKKKIEKIIISQGYTGGSWVMKHAVPKWVSWLGYPNVKFVCCFRDLDEIYESHLRVWKYNEEEIGRKGRWWRKEKLIEQATKHQTIMTNIIKEHGGFTIFPKMFTESNKGETLAYHLLKFCGLPFYTNVFNDFVDKSLWNGGSKCQAKD